MLVETDDTLLPLHLERGEAAFLGEADLTDYHSPLGGDGERACSALVEALPPGTALVFDSLPGEVAGPIVRGLARAGPEAPCEQHEIAAVLDLPASHGEYLAGLSAKQRHEVRRKARRFSDTLGEPALARDGSAEAFAAFLSMHRAAPGAKGSFMTGDMERFFAALLTLDGAVLHLLRSGDGEPVAAAFGFEDDEAYYLYNSAFDPAVAPASPGAVLVDLLIADAVAAGRDRFDFLKGDEAYKFRLGATPRPLYRVTATT
jgi:CelD/BcsL family acetyltransferase involved in cellulose biosynthesis